MLRSLLFLAVVSVASGDTITYELQSYEMSTLYDAISNAIAETDDVHSVSGFIKTDGTIGELVAENILDYHVIVSGSEPFELTPESIADGLPIGIQMRKLFASETDLFVEPDDNLFGSFLIGGGVRESSRGFSWSYQPAINPAPVAGATAMLGNQQWYSTAAGLPRTTVATVPEADSVAMMLFGLVGMALLNFRRKTIEAEIIFEEAHHNAIIGCDIAAAWVAYVKVNGQPQPKYPCGDTLTEAIANVQREYPGCKIVGEV